MNVRDRLVLVKEKYGGKIDEKKLAIDTKRLAKGEPLDYVIGWKPFLNTRIDLSYKPLIPRAETEFWVESAISEIKKDTREKITVLDMCAGSGCVGIAVAKSQTIVFVDFVDSEKKMLTQIKKNIRLNNIESRRTRAIQSNLFVKIKKKTYDYILANPPYIPTVRKKKLDSSVVAFEPNRALFAGVDGLTVIRTFLREVKKYGHEGTKIWIEFDSGQKKALEKIVKKNAWKHAVFQKDQYNRWRWVELTL